jgi:hypothetical protein
MVETKKNRYQFFNFFLGVVLNKSQTGGKMKSGQYEWAYNKWAYNKIFIPLAQREKSSLLMSVP